MPILCQEYMLFFCLPLSIQPRLNLLSTQQQGRAHRKFAYTLGTGPAYISDMSSTSGYMGAKYVQEFGPRFFDMSSASGYMGAKHFQEVGPRFLVCHVPNVACHGVSIYIVSISSMSCRVRILRVSVSMPCRGHPVELQNDWNCSIVGCMLFPQPGLPVGFLQ